MGRRAGNSAASPRTRAAASGGSPAGAHRGAERSPDTDRAAPAMRAPAATGPVRRPLLIVNADDFGASHSVNAAVLRAYREGVLTSASLMVTGDAFEEAVELARSAPDLAVGLHLVLVQGRAASPHARVPHLTDRDGRLPRDPAGFGLRLAFDPLLQRETAAEIAAQLERFAATGLPLSHVDGHLNFHLHPAVFTPLARGAAQYGARGIRLPRDDLRLALRHDRRRLLKKLLLAAAFGWLSAWARRRLPAGMHVTERVYGLFQSGGLTPAYVLDAVAALHGSSAELYAHPATEAGDEALGPNTTDLATLCDPAVAAALRRADVRLGGYATLGEG